MPAFLLQFPCEVIWNARLASDPHFPVFHLLWRDLDGGCAATKKNNSRYALFTIIEQKIEKMPGNPNPVTKFKKGRSKVPGSGRQPGQKVGCGAFSSIFCSVFVEKTYQRLLLSKIQSKLPVAVVL
jgi:hypothetical protein